jgi:nucleoside-diphosphate kinase
LVKARKVGKVIDQILSEGFEISAMEQFRINRPIADEFFEIYKVFNYI